MGFRKRQNASISPDVEKDSHPLAENQAAVKRGTSTRRHAIWVASFFYLIAFVFLILVEIGNTSGSRVLGDIYFFKLNLADILPQSVPPTLTLQNSIARTLGLHDFYQVGLWNYCEGYLTDGITHCSKSSSSFWFNPVAVLLSELFAGASIALPSEVNDILRILRIASHIMFGFFMAGLVLSFILMLATPVVIRSRWWSLPYSIVSFLVALLVLVASALGTAMSIVFKYALSSQSDLNIKADVGIKMLVFMWIATLFTVLSFFIHAGMGCCCTSRRDIRTGRKGGRTQTEETSEMRGYKLPKFGRKSTTST
ncbi:Uu.00g100980.m01.CDS01 [Anthostomella pinea]|uniref:Uu.00g100980.m01.CDS01 n=1 Tax=Anthostomella pinea TaxID=933095 RepID=A0AAI8V804_9PEZI|nr:Uu.00g100980.m01.CDS01 [Anthostomella pinea]